MGQLTIWHGWWPQHFPDDEDDPVTNVRGNFSVFLFF